MTPQRLYVIHGMGRDEVGLVGRITAPIAQAGGNIQDLRQDVLHGLFTIYMVVDLAESRLDADGLQRMIQQIAADTGLRITSEQYSPVPRSRRQAHPLPQEAAFFAANRCSMACDVGVIDSPPSAVQRSSRGIWTATRWAVSMTSSSGMT